MTHLDLDAIRRDARDGLPVLPMTVLALIDRCKMLENDVATLRSVLEWRHACENCGGRGIYWIDVDREAETEVCDCWIRADQILQDENPGTPLLSAARAYFAAVDRCDGIVAAEQALREAVETAP